MASIESRISLCGQADVSRRMSCVAKGAGGLPKLSWSGERSKRFSHYNLYAGKAANFKCDRRTLIASPDREKYLDWHALPAEPFYKVTQVTRDGLESAPSNAAKAE